MNLMPSNMKLIITKKRRNKVQKLLFIAILFFGLSAQSQDNSQLLKRAIMLVHADYSSFSLNSKDSVIKEIISDYEVRELKSKGFLETKFYTVKPKCIECKECFYVMAYYSPTKRFFKLKGFKNNEFTEFFNGVLMKEFPNISSKSPKKALKMLLEIPLEIEKFDLKIAYDKYYENYKESLFDSSSCYRKMQIQEY